MHLSELNSKNNDFVVRVATRGGKVTREPLYLEGHPKRIEQDSQRTNTDAPSPSNKKKKKTDRTLHASSGPVADTPENTNDILRPNPVMNMNLVIMLMMMFTLMLNLVMIMM
mgnify:CR=1 FL=1